MTHDSSHDHVKTIFQQYESEYLEILASLKQIHPNACIGQEVYNRLAPNIDPEDPIQIQSLLETMLAEKIGTKYQNFDYVSQTIKTNTLPIYYLVARLESDYFNPNLQPKHKNLSSSLLSALYAHICKKTDGYEKADWLGKMLSKHQLSAEFGIKINQESLYALQEICHQSCQRTKTSGQSN